MAEVQQFLERLDGPSRAVFEHIRALVGEEAPDVEEGTSDGLPALKYHGKPLLGFDLAKGTIRFSADRPPPDTAVRRLVAARMDEIDGG